MKYFHLLSAIALLLLGANSVSAVIAIYISPPGDLISTVPNIDQTEDFTGAPANWTGSTTYVGATGLYTQVTGEVTTIMGSIYGIDESRHISLGDNAQVSLNLGQDTQYFSFAWPAGDSENQFTVFDGTTNLFTIDLADVVTFLPNTVGAQVTAINGTNYDTQDYYGRPGSAGDTNGNEPYAIIHILASAGSSFDRIVFAGGDDGGRFEIDNHTLIHSSSPTVIPPSTYVELFENVPEPSTYSFILGCVALGFVCARRKR